MPLCFRSSCPSVLQCITNFGNGALVSHGQQAQRSAEHIPCYSVTALRTRRYNEKRIGYMPTAGRASMQNPAAITVLCAGAMSMIVHELASCSSGRLGKISRPNLLVRGWSRTACRPVRSWMWSSRRKRPSTISSAEGWSFPTAPRSLRIRESA